MAYSGLSLLMYSGRYSDSAETMYLQQPQLLSLNACASSPAPPPAKPCGVGQLQEQTHYRDTKTPHNCACNNNHQDAKSRCASRRLLARPLEIGLLPGQLPQTCA